MTETIAFLDSNSAKVRARGLLDPGEIIIDGDIGQHGSINAQTIRAAMNKLPPDEPIVLLKPEDALKHGFVDRIVPAIPQPATTDDTCTCADCPRRGAPPARSVAQN